MSNFDWGSIDFLEIEWDVDPRITAAAFTELAEEIDRDLVQPAVAARQVIMDDVREHFEREEAPSGERWAPWAPSYAPRAQSENIGILRKTEDLYDATQEITSWPIIGNDIWVNTATWPDYWRIHQQGGLIMSTQTMIRRMRRRRAKEEGASDHGRIPARPYIGLSEDAELVVFGVYDFWFQGKLRIITQRSTGLAQFQMPSGRIGKRIGLRN
jgi:phage gpG-like protein